MVNAVGGAGAGYAPGVTENEEAKKKQYKPNATEASGSVALLGNPQASNFTAIA